LAFIHRLHGNLLLKRDPNNPAPAERAFQTAIAIAREQGARSFGLQAALKLAKLYQSTNRPADAHAVLAPALEGFAPTPEMPEMPHRGRLSRPRYATISGVGNGVTTVMSPRSRVAAPDVSSL
jgi:hypothetical protein